MTNPLRGILYSLLATVALAQSTDADLIQDGYFKSLTYSGSATLTTPYFGQFGTGSGSTLVLANWSTTGYNFVFAPNTIDSGTKSGPNMGQPNEAPGEYNMNGYGNTYMWGTNNGGTTTIAAVPGGSAVPGGGNFIAADGAFQTAAITQTITGLTVGRVYTLSFYWAGAQQTGYTGPTSDSWQVTLGGQTFYSTPTVNVASQGFSGWMQQTFNFSVGSSSETLSFLASGTPSGQPPFALLGGVSLNPAPEPSAWTYVAGLGTACMLIEIVRRRRRSSFRNAGAARQ